MDPAPPVVRCSRLPQARAWPAPGPAAVVETTGRVEPRAAHSTSRGERRAPRLGATSAPQPALPPCARACTLPARSAPRGQAFAARAPPTPVARDNFHASRRPTNLSPASQPAYAPGCLTHKLCTRICVTLAWRDHMVILDVVCCLFIYFSQNHFRSCSSTSARKAPKYHEQPLLVPVQRWRANGELAVRQTLSLLSLNGLLTSTAASGARKDVYASLLFSFRTRQHHHRQRGK